MKIGLIAGSGALPDQVINGAAALGYDVFVAAISGFSRASDFSGKGQDFGLAEFGKMTKAFKKSRVTHVSMAGNITRPDFKTLKPDLKAIRHLPGVIKAAQHGDDALLRHLIGLFEQEGFEIIAPQDLCAELVLNEGFLGRITMGSLHRADAEKACRIAFEIGRLDIGQGAIVARGVVLAVEAQEGTDAMLSRLSNLPQDLCGTPQARAGVLAKMIKPGQDKRVDLPTIGLATVQAVDKAGLAGIVAESGGAFVMDKAAVIEAANRAGIFIAGLPPSIQ